jgi:hypothetical protein
MKTIRIGAGSGFGGDRIEPAVELAEKGDVDYLVFECLAERTIALAQQAKLQDPEGGYDRLLRERMTAVLPHCRDRGFKIISNMGAANPKGAAKAIAEIAREVGAPSLKIAYVLGDDVVEAVKASDFSLIESEADPAKVAATIVSANAYLGIEPIIDALRQGADIVITGRCSDPALFAAPVAFEFGWKLDDWDRLGKGIVIGHLLECTGQLTGGYFADPGYKDVSDLARLGFPYADVSEDGNAILGKVEGSGGEISIRTCKEQLLYEVHDPSSYYQPDVIANFTGVRFKSVGPDRVAVSGGTGRAKPPTLKVTIGYRDGFIGDAQISYGGEGAVNRARLALDILTKRLELVGVKPIEIRLDIIGLNATLRGGGARREEEPLDVRARAAGRTATMRDAQQIGREMEAIWINGPAGGGGVTHAAREVIAAASMLLPREKIKTSVQFESVQ